MKKNLILFGVSICFAVCCLGSCGQQNGKVMQGCDNDSVGCVPHPTDTMATGDKLNKWLSWEEIPSDGEVLPLDFEKWLTIMNYIKDNYWSRPTPAMLADAGLEVMYETDSIDDDGIKDVHFIYGRQTKCVTDSAGTQYHTFDGDHAILFEVYAYTSSGAEIHFHNPADMRNFMEQAINRGVVENNNQFLVCNKPIGKGLHKIRKVYNVTEKQQGAYKELYFIHPVYEPDADWNTCYITLDFLRHSIDIE